MAETSSEVLARASALGLASAAYMAPVIQYPNRNVALRHICGSSAMTRAEGRTAADPNARSYPAGASHGSSLATIRQSQ